jgi:hypothetical protein
MRDVKAKLSYRAGDESHTAFVTFQVQSTEEVADHLEVMFGRAVASEDVVIAWVTDKPTTPTEASDD